MAATRHLLPQGHWHWQHGPMDLIVGAEASPHADPQVLEQAHEAAWQRFTPLLDTLVQELALLRQPVRPAAPCPLQGVVARRMWHACLPHAQQGHFITPMAAVAGAVAQEVLGAYQRAGVERAWVNNGGDIALHLSPGTRVRVGLWGDVARLDPALAYHAQQQRAAQAAKGAAPGAPELDAALLDAQLDLPHYLPVRGLATSGWRGRSHSLGIADSVTVLAATAAEADAAATIIANAVDLEHPGIRRQSANTLRDDSDLGAIPVTVEVPALSRAQARLALARGVRQARVCMRHSPTLLAAVLHCQGQWASVGLRALVRAVPPSLIAAPAPAPLAQRSPTYALQACLP